VSATIAWSIGDNSGVFSTGLMVAVLEDVRLVDEVASGTVSHRTTAAINNILFLCTSIRLYFYSLSAFSTPTNSSCIGHCHMESVSRVCKMYRIRYSKPFGHA